MQNYKISKLFSMEGGSKMSRKKMLQGLVALGILAAVNAPAHAMQEEIFSYGGYDIFRV